MRKRWIIGGLLTVALVAGYTAYWHKMANAFEQNLTLWPEEWRAKGFQIDIERSGTFGFPRLLRSRVHNLEIRSPPGPHSWRASKQYGAVFLTAQPWQPFGFGIEFEREQSWTITDGIGRELLRLDSLWGFGDIGLALDGQLEKISFAIGQTTIHSNGLPTLRIGAADASLTLGEAPSPPDQAADINLKLYLNDILIGLPPDSPLGNHVTRLITEGFVTGQISPGSPREALAYWRDRGGVAEVTKFIANWGPLAITADATLALDQNLQPLVAGTAVVRGYNEAIDAMVAGGLMSQGQATATKVALAAIAESDEAGNKVRLPVTVQDGFLFLGPLRVAAVKQIEW